MAAQPRPTRPAVTLPLLENCVRNLDDPVLIAVASTLLRFMQINVVAIKRKKKKKKRGDDVGSSI